MKQRQRIVALAGSLALALSLAGCMGGHFGGSTDQAAPAVTAGGQATQVASSVGTPSVADSPSSTPAAAAPTTPAVAPRTTSVPSATVRAPAPAKATPAPTKAAPKVAAKPKAPAKPPAPAGPRTTLRPGDKGADVRAMQTRLSNLGYWLGTPDGSWGNLTTQAVLALQKSAGIGRDAVAGPMTMRALANGVRPRTTLSGNGVEIDKARQVLMIVRGGSVKYILNTSTGGGYRYISSAGYPAIATTPAGTFRVNFVVNGMDHGKLGDLWRPRYFNGGIAVHGAGSVPAYPASHGCARVSNAAMDWIWSNNLMPMGSTVKVR